MKASRSVGAFAAACRPAPWTLTSDNEPSKASATQGRNRMKGTCGSSQGRGAILREDAGSGPKVPAEPLLAVRAVVAQSLPHGHVVPGRHVGLRVVHGAEDEPAARGEILETAAHLLAHLPRCSARQDVLRVHAAAPERQAAPVQPLEL